MAARPRGTGAVRSAHRVAARLADGGATGTNRRTLLNYPEQAGGADCMRLGAIAATEAGIRIVAIAHDAFWITAPLPELDDAIETMKRLMVRASNVITGGLDIPVEVGGVGRFPRWPGEGRAPGAKGPSRCEDDRA